MHIRNYPILYTLAFTAMLVVPHSRVQAQIPGHWVRSLTVSHPNAQANGIHFIDSAYGLAFIDSGTKATRVYRTTNGGNSWSLWGSTDSGYYMASGVVHSIQMLSARDIYYAGATSDFWVSHDSGHTFQVNLAPWAPIPTIAAKMFTPGFGRCVTGYENPSFQVYETRDSGLSFQLRSSTKSITGECEDAFFFDSSNWLVALHNKNILRTRDGGSTWDTVLNPSHIAFYNEIITSPDRIHMYVAGGLYDGQSSGHAVYSSSFFESADTGNTWRADSSIYGDRIARMVSPGYGKLWALVNHGNQTAADSLFYSSDDGKTWAIDSVTFIGKTAWDMVWPDSNHGYILMQISDTTIVYRYVSGQAGVSDNINNPQQVSVTCYPNPASSILNIESSYGLLSILDPLGRSYEVHRNANTLDISSLPFGVYFVSDGRSWAKFVKE